MRYLFADFKAFHHLRQEQACAIVSEEAGIRGYEAYMVEQWVCERRKVNVITSYTGDQSNTVRVGVLALPRNPALWTPRTKAYFDELLKGYARAKETELGVLFVTSLSSFPSFLTLVSVPGGDVRKTWEFFDVNENLKRMGCGGRASLAICEPSGTTAAKFKNIYKIHETVPICFAVKEVVVLVQLSLFYFGVLQPEYCDGLLCNETVEAINTWWDLWGVRKYNTKPKDGVLGPSTVAGLIGFVIGVRNRNAYVLNSSKIVKDPFDVEGFIAGLGRFQKHERLPKSRIIDQRTMDRLHMLTNKGSYNSDIIDLFKSSIKEVSGKQHLHMTSSETFNLEQLTKSLQGARCKYLWAGKGSQRPVENTLLQNCVGIPMSSIGHTETVVTRDIRRVIRNPAASTQTSLVSNNKTQAPAVPDTSRRAMFKLRKRDVVEVPPSRIYRGIRGRLRSTSPNDSVDDDIAGTRANSSTPELDLPLDDVLTDRLVPQEYHDSDDSDDDIRSRPRRQDSIKTTHTNASRTSLDTKPALHFRKRSKSVDQFHHELQVPEQLEKHHRSVMRRNSFSLIENFILRQPPEKSFVSEKRIRRSYEKSQLYHFLFKRHVKKIRQVCEQIDQESRMLGKAKMRDDVLFDKLTSYLKNSYREEARLKAALHEVEVMSSRIRYESKMLQSKIQDVEETMESFVGKVQSLEERVQKASASRGYGSGGFNVHKPDGADDATGPMSPLESHRPPPLNITKNNMVTACEDVGRGRPGGVGTPIQSPLGDIFEDGPTPKSLSAVFWPDTKPGEESFLQRLFVKLCTLAGYETTQAEVCKIVLDDD